MKSTVGVGLIGCGRAGRIHARCFAGRTAGARLVAVADSDSAAALQTANDYGADNWYTDYRRLIADAAVDAVVVVTPTNSHCEIVVTAAAAGKHVLCEKPMALNVDECSQMIDAADRAGVKLQIGFMRRFDAGFRAAKQAIDNGEIGEVVLVKSLTHGPSVPQRWMYDIAASNGPLAEVNSHDIDTLRWFTGSEVREVYALAGNYRCPEARDEFPDFYDNVVLSTRLENGAQGLIEGAVSVAYGYDSRAEILGTKGILFVGGLAERPLTVCSASLQVQQPIVKSWRTLFSDAYEAEDAGFVQVIVDDGVPEVGGIDGLRAVEVVNAGNRSIRESLPVRLETQGVSV
ncbi:MAG: oxidoreductase [Spirochaetaceae bacterium]|nr:MAG: oxidoreductase [Spirochaetaceae bacterium]